MKKWYFLTFILLTFIHFKAFSFFGIEFSLSLIIFPFWVLYTFKNISFTKNQKLLYFILVTLPFVNLYFIKDYPSFFQTYIYYFISISVLYIFIYKGKLRFQRSKVIDFFKRFQKFLFVISSIQFISIYFFNYNGFYNLFGDFQLSIGVIDMDSIIGNMRLKALYGEPSYFALVINSFFISIKFLDHKIKKTNFLLTVIMLFFAQSGFGFVLFLVVIFMHFLRLKRLKLKYYAIFAFIFFGFILKDEIFIALRIYEIFSNDFTLSSGLSSGFMRMVFPLIVITFIFKDLLLFGLPLGGVPVYLDEYHNISNINDIHNGLFLLIINFGLIAVFSIVYLLKKYRNNDLKFQLLVFFLIASMNSGAIYYPLSLLFLLIIPYLTIIDEA
jgi:hypothetical protein